MHEVRYYGRTVARFETESEANGYRTRRLSHEVEGPAFNAQELTVAPAKPFALYCAGNLVDTFDTAADAKTAQDAIAAEERPRGVPPYQEADFTIAKL